MATEVSVKHDALPKGTEIEIANIAVVPNGGSVILSDEQEELFKERNGQTLRDAFKDSEIFKTKASTQAAFDKQEEARAAKASKEATEAESEVGTSEAQGGEKN